MSTEVVRLVKIMPFIGAQSMEEYLNALIVHLPSWERASSLCEIYYEHCAWHSRPVSREQLVNEIFPKIYKRGNYQQTSGFGSQDLTKHTIRADEVAILFGIFSVAALVDLTLPPCNEEAETYFQLGRATAVSQSLFENPSLASIQCIGIFAAYLSLSNRFNALDGASSMISLACSLSRSVSTIVTYFNIIKFVYLTILTQMGLRKAVLYLYFSFMTIIFCHRSRPCSVEA